MLLLINGIANCQSEDFLDEFEKLIDNENVQLIPEKMIFTQKFFWGEKGLLRKVGISKLNIENREKELILREKMLKAHQIIGYVTFAAMIAQGISAIAWTVLSTSTDALTFVAGLPQRISKRAFAISPPIVATGSKVLIALPTHKANNNSLNGGISLFGKS